ncbi:type III secretion system chaperone family protein [Kribbella monticola]|uniref:hypothetical protein n=1 Tax=Kribbella monticola TaxID=2185285 RepID=UPI000DD3F9F5|nr:hypothetical protein [Kribbella monticola]
MLAFSGVLAVLAGLGIVVVRAFRSRDSVDRALAEYALEIGFFYAASNRELVRRWRGSPFGRGDIRVARNVLTGYRHGRRVIAFDYMYIDIGRPAQQFVVLVIRLQAELPQIEMTYRWPGSGVLDSFRSHRIEPESEEFNREFAVAAADRRYGHAMMHPRMMAFLLSGEGLPWRIEGADLVCWTEGRLLPAMVLERAEYLAGIAELIPSFVWADYGRAARRAD